MSVSRAISVGSAKFLRERAHRGLVHVFSAFGAFLRIGTRFLDDMAKTSARKKEDTTTTAPVKPRPTRTHLAGE